MLQINTLGGWTITRADGTSQAVPVQRVSLLALLVAAGVRGIQRDRAVALLWPESGGENARHSVGQALYALRRDFASADVVVGTTTLRLNADVVTCDAWELDAAERAGDDTRVVELYVGPFLDGVRLRGSSELDHLVDAERARLAMLHANAVESLAGAAALEGDAQAAVSWWRRLAAHQPLSSRVALELVRAVAATGDRTAALDAARVHETLVRNELDAAPDPAFSAFVDALKREPAQANDNATREEPPTPRRRKTVVETVRLVEPLPQNAARVSPRHRLAWRLTLATGAAVLGLALIPGARRFVGRVPRSTRNVCTSRGSRIGRATPHSARLVASHATGFRRVSNRAVW